MMICLRCLLIATSGGVVIIDAPLFVWYGRVRYWNKDTSTYMYLCSCACRVRRCCHPTSPSRTIKHKH
jgi:hypothetical protein